MFKVGFKDFSRIAMQHIDDIATPCNKYINGAVSKPISTQQIGDTFQKSATAQAIKPSCIGTKQNYKFDDIYNVINLNNGRIRLLPKAAEINGHKISTIEMPEYMYHVTSKTNWDKISSSKTIQRTTDEQLQGVYLIDKENFLSRYQRVKGLNRNIDLMSSLIRHASKSNNGTTDLVLIRIPTENLLKTGKLRFRTQEDFFYYQDMLFNLQKDLKQKFSIRMLSNDKNRAQFEKYVLDNNLMTKAELDKFMLNMKNSLHQGHKLNELSNFETNSAIEYIFNKDIVSSQVPGIKRKVFNIEDVKDSKTGNFDTEKLQKKLESVFR